MQVIEEMKRLSAPRVLQTVVGDFTVEVQVTCSLQPQHALRGESTTYHGAGLLVYADTTHFLRVERDAGVQDENAMVPLRVHIRLHDGHQYSKRLDAVLGSPEKPLSRTAHLHKFRRCWQHGGKKATTRLMPLSR
jgi:hypothetical protein